MGKFSRDTFDPAKHYTGVRLQEGVPLLDADWNELEDIRKHELRDFLRAYAGDGVPPGNGGFRITTAPTDNSGDFIISGDARGPGRCVVAGQDCRIESDLRYTEQALYATRGDETHDAHARMLAERWNVANLPALTASSGPRTDLVYLDVWEREIDSVADESLVHPAIGVETCVRLKREWTVRVAENTSDAPEPAPGHSHYALARLTRDATGITGIQDLRRTVFGFDGGAGLPDIALRSDEYGADLGFDPTRFGAGVFAVTRRSPGQPERPDVFAFDAATGNAAFGMTIDGTTRPGARLQVLDRGSNPDGATFVVGPLDAGNLRLGYHDSYVWMQSHSSRPLAINAIGNNVGIGLTSPEAKLHVAGDTIVGDSLAIGLNRKAQAKLEISGAMRFSHGDPNAVLIVRGTTESGAPDGEGLRLRHDAHFFGSDAGDALVFEKTGTGEKPRGGFAFVNTGNTGAVPAFVLDGRGHAALGGKFPDPTYRLDVAGPVRATNISEVSDARLKRDIRPLTGALEKIGRLRGVRFDWRDVNAQHAGSNVPGELGLIAQEVQVEFPEVVTEDASGTLAVGYSKLVAVLIEAIKELKIECEELRALHAGR